MCCTRAGKKEVADVPAGTVLDGYKSCTRRTKGLLVRLCQFPIVLFVHQRASRPNLMYSQTHAPVVVAAAAAANTARALFTRACWFCSPY